MNIVDMDQDEGIDLVVDKEKDVEVEGRHVDKQLGSQRGQQLQVLYVTSFHSIDHSSLKDIAEDVAHVGTPSSPPHGIPSPPHKPSSPPQQPHVTPPVPTQGEVFPETFQQVLDTCSDLLCRVEHFEHDNAAQRLEIVKLKAKLKKLEQTDKVKSLKFRMMNEDERIELVKDSEITDSERRHVDKQAELYNLDLDHSSKVLSMQEDDTEVQEAVEIVTTAKLMTEVVTAAATQVVAASKPILAVKPKILKIAAAPAVLTRRRKGVVIRDPDEELPSDTLAENPKVKYKGKGILIEAPKPIKKKDQIEIDAKHARKWQEEINKEHEETYKNIDWNAALDHVQSKEPQYIKKYHGMKKKPQSKSRARKNMIFYLKNTEGYKMDFFKGMKYDEILPIFQAKFDANMRFLFKSRKEMEAEDQEIIKSINETHAQKAAKRRKLSEEAQEAEDLRKRLEIVKDEDDDVFVEATPLAQKVPVVDYQIVVIDNKPRYKIIRADDTHQLYISLTTLLKNFDREDLETLWRIRNQKSVHGLALVKRWKLLTSCGVQSNVDAASLRLKLFKDVAAVADAKSLEPSTNDLKMCDSSVESSRPNHSDHDSTSSVSTPASESRDTIVIDCDKQEDFPSVCSIETDVKSSKPLCNKNAGGKGILGRRPIGKPINPNRPELVFAGQQNPVSAGPPNSVSAGQQNTVSAGQPNLVFAGPPNPVYAAQPNPVYAGDGIIGQRPLNIQHTSTYFHSFTHNNQQILFLINHNSLYSLYMTGELNGKTAVKPSAGWP
nr:hypothetical protein [Tanacetum cinerariifolium]